MLQILLIIGLPFVEAIDIIPLFLEMLGVEGILLYFFLEVVYLNFSLTFFS